MTIPNQSLSLPSPHTPNVVFVNRIADTRVLAAVVKKSKPLDMHAAHQKHFDNASSLIVDLHGLTVEKFFIGLMNSAQRFIKTGLSILYVVFKQLLWAFSDVLEKKKLTLLVPVNTARGTTRQLSEQFSDVVPTMVTKTDVYNATSWRHTEQELGSYVNASQKVFRNALHISIAGPDSTKVGTDFGVTMGALMNPVTKKVCVALPQVCTLSLRYC